jgi:hypothetical protein
VLDCAEHVRGGIDREWVCIKSGQLGGFKHQSCPAHCLDRGRVHGLPYWFDRRMDVTSVDFRYALAAELRENVEAQWAQPSTGRSIPFELCFSPLKHSHGEFFQRRIVSRIVIGSRPAASSRFHLSRICRAVARFVVGMLPSPISLRRPRWLYLKTHFALPPFLTKRNPPPSSILPSLAFLIWMAVSRLRALMFDPLDRFSPPAGPPTDTALQWVAMRLYATALP